MLGACQNLDVITGFRTVQQSEPATTNELQWGSAGGAGCIAAIVLILVPQGNPWAALTFFSPVVLGRVVPSVPLPLAWLMHLSVSIIYALIISKVVAGLTQQRAVLAGGVCGLVLYGINLA